MCSKKFRKKTNHFFLEAKMTKYVLQLYMYYNFSQYANPPKYVVDTADIWKTLYVFHICFFGQWFVEIKLKKLYILTCVFVSNFVPRYWHKMVATPCSRHVFDFAMQSSRSARTLTISSWFTMKNVMEGISLTHRSSIDW